MGLFSPTELPHIHSIYLIVDLFNLQLDSFATLSFHAQKRVNTRLYTYYVRGFMVLFNFGVVCVAMIFHPLLNDRVTLPGGIVERRERRRRGRGKGRKDERK